MHVYITHICQHTVYKYAYFHNAYVITSLAFNLKHYSIALSCCFQDFMTHYLFIFMGSNADQQVVHVHNKLHQCLCHSIFIYVITLVLIHSLFCLNYLSPRPLSNSLRLSFFSGYLVPLLHSYYMYSIT